MNEKHHDWLEKLEDFKTIEKNNKETITLNDVNFLSIIVIALPVFFLFTTNNIISNMTLLVMAIVFNFIFLKKDREKRKELKKIRDEKTKTRLKEKIEIIRTICHSKESLQVLNDFRELYPYSYEEIKKYQKKRKKEVSEKNKKREINIQ